MEVSIPFATTYLSESGFSTLVTIKTKSRNRLDVQYDMRVALLKTTPQFNVFIQAKQQPLSKGCHLDVVREPSTSHDPESDAGGSLSSWQGHPSRQGQG
jgi:hypothetical protein